MTTQAFFEELKDKTAFANRLVTSGKHSPKLFPAGYWEVREKGYLLSCQGDCPITFVANDPFHSDYFQDYEPKDWDDAAVEHLEMAHGEAQAIVHAADNIEGHDPALRKQLLEACGVTEEVKQ